MTSQTISAAFTETILVPGDGDILLVKAGVLGTVAEGAAIDASGGASDRTLTINGRVRATGTIGSDDAIGLLLGDSADPGAGEDNAVRIGTDGLLYGLDSGLRLFGDEISVVNDGTVRGAEALRGDIVDSSILNRGRIVGTSIGIALDGDNIDVRNLALIESEQSSAVYLSGTALTLVNRGGISTPSFDAAVRVIAADGAKSELTNRGNIEAADLAYAGDVGDDTVANFGKITGDIWLEGGNNVFFNARGAKVDGEVVGGDEDDVFRIMGAKVRLDDWSADDQDKVLTDITFRLPDKLEQLLLIGSSDIDAYGNDADNDLQGNDADNMLVGFEGNDTLNGGRGDDDLKGGMGADTFVFDARFGHDRVFNFNADDDYIDFSGLAALPDLDAVGNAIEQVGGNVVIEVGKNRIIFLDTDVDLVLDRILFA